MGKINIFKYLLKFKIQQKQTNNKKKRKKRNESTVDVELTNMGPLFGL